MEYIKSANPKAADKMVKQIYKSFDPLANSPFIGGSLEKRYEISTDYMY
jgi:plasmid stabilization system protein ParE